MGIDDFATDKTVIVRTEHGGVWCGTLAKKLDDEVILTNARRLWCWWCRESISLSGVVVYGINREKSVIAAPVPEVWLEAIEIMPIEGEPAASIMEAEIAKAVF